MSLWVSCFNKVVKRALEERRSVSQREASSLYFFFLDLLSSPSPSHPSLPLTPLFLSPPSPFHPPPLSLSSKQRRRTTKQSFKLLEGGTPQFEVREYSPAVWSTASFPAGTAWDQVRSKGFDRNFNYIKGAGVAMTAPVVSFWLWFSGSFPEGGSKEILANKKVPQVLTPFFPPPKKKTHQKKLTRLAGDGSSSVSFLVPSKYGTSPPAPKPDSGVTIDESPSRRVVVRSWVGAEPRFESREDVDAALAALAADADKAGLIVGAPPKDGGVQGWTAGYDSPMTDPGRRRHEVWLPLVARKSEVLPAPGGGAGGGMAAPVASASALP